MENMTIKKDSKDILPVHGQPMSFMYALMKAMEKDQATMEQMQITDAQTTELDATIETNLYTYYNAQLQKYADGVAWWDSPDGQKQDKKHWQANAAADQAEYNKYAAEEQSAAGQQDGGVQAAQGQTSTDASNLQMKVQLAQGVESILAALSSLLGRLTA